MIVPVIRPFRIRRGSLLHEILSGLRTIEFPDPDGVIGPDGITLNTREEKPDGTSRNSTAS